MTPFDNQAQSHYHATHRDRETVYGGYSMYRGLFVQFSHSCV